MAAEILTFEIGYYRGNRFVGVVTGIKSIKEAEMWIDLKQPHYKHLLLIH